MSYAYLGPAGTFAHAALRALLQTVEADELPCATVPLALDAVRSGAARAALVPMENSVEGAVPVTLDELATGLHLSIRQEVLLPVTFTLMARAGTALADVRRIATHPHAEAQCRAWVAAHLPDAVIVHAMSTADAAALLAPGGAGVATRGADGATDLGHDAAIAPRIAADRYGLAVLADDIGAHAGAVTRFVLVGPPGPPPDPTGHDRSSIIAYIGDDHPGALLEILTEFAVRGVNLTRIESRPTGRELGRYRFTLDCEGHVHDARVGEAMMGLRRICADVRFLGSYPRADPQQAAPVRSGTSDGDFVRAHAWLGEVRAGRHD